MVLQSIWFACQLSVSQKSACFPLMEHSVITPPTFCILKGITFSEMWGCPERKEFFQYIDTSAILFL